MPLRVAIIDDHHLICLGLSHMLAGFPDIQVVGTADSGEKAIQLVRETRPDVLLMDLEMPGMGGHEASLRLMREWPELRIIMLSVTVSGPMPARLLQDGVAGYLTKGADLDEVVMAIRRAAAGERYVNPAMAQTLALQQHAPASLDDPFGQLSARELQVLERIVRGHRLQDIAVELHLSPKTVSTYRARLLQKLHADSDIALARLALDHGLIR